MLILDLDLNRYVGAWFVTQLAHHGPICSLHKCDVETKSESALRAKYVNAFNMFKCTINLTLVSKNVDTAMQNPTHVDIEPKQGQQSWLKYT